MLLLVVLLSGCAAELAPDEFVRGEPPRRLEFENVWYFSDCFPIGSPQFSARLLERGSLDADATLADRLLTLADSRLLGSVDYFKPDGFVEQLRESDPDVESDFAVTDLRFTIVEERISYVFSETDVYVDRMLLTGYRLVLSFAVEAGRSEPDNGIVRVRFPEQAFDDDRFYPCRVDDDDGRTLSPEAYGFYEHPGMFEYYVHAKPSFPYWWNNLLRVVPPIGIGALLVLAWLAYRVGARPQGESPRDRFETGVTAVLALVVLAGVGLVVRWLVRTQDLYFATIIPLAPMVIMLVIADRLQWVTRLVTFAVAAVMISSAISVYHPTLAGLTSVAVIIAAGLLIAGADAAAGTGTSGSVDDHEQRTVVGVED